MKRQNYLNTEKKWYEEISKASNETKHSKTEVQVLELEAEAKKCLDSESAAYQLKQSKSRDSEYGWLKTALNQGTTSDKIAASIVLIQNSPKHNLSRLTSLISQVRTAKHNQCSMLIVSLRDLFISDLLHPTYRLLKFNEQDLDRLDKIDINDKPFVSRNKLLAHWYFEDQLREIYERYVTSLATIANDTVDTNREKAIAVMSDLMIGNSEQEHKLLNLLVNKIGDPTSKVASKAVFCINNLLNEHPNMKCVVLNEVEKLLFRTNIASKAQYFAICLLTQFVLNKTDTELATNLINVYFAFFKACLKKGEPDSRMMAAILSGVNRSYLYAKVESTQLKDHIDSVYKVVHVGSFNVSLNALSLLFQVVGKNPSQSDRFYSAFYRKLFDPEIATTNKRAIFFNLLSRVLRNDHSIVRLQAIIKRILQTALYYPANMTCAILYTISQVLHLKKMTNIVSTKSEIDVEVKNEIVDISEDEPKSPMTQKQTEHEQDSIILSNMTVGPVETENSEKTEIKDEKIHIKTEPNEKMVYDPFSRNPLNAKASSSFYAELVALASHFHPSVVLFAKSIIAGKRIDYNGDLLEDLTMIRFLDRYVFRNPKKLDDKKVSKQNDPLAKRTGYTPKGVKSLPVGSAAYLSKSEEHIPVDELFLYEYLKKRQEFKPRVKKEDEDDDDNESVNSEDFNAMLDNLNPAEDIEELDFASDFSASKKRSKKSVEEDDISEVSGSEDEEIDDDDDDEVEDFEDLDMMDDEDLSDIDIDDIDDDNLSDMDFDEEESSSKRKFDGGKGNAKKKSKGINDKVFVSAEEFAEMLENQGRSKFKHGGSNAMSTKDGASDKQLDWETDRNDRHSTFRQSKKKPFKKSFNSFKSKKPTNSKNKRH